MMCKTVYRTSCIALHGAGMQASEMPGTYGTAHTTKAAPPRFWIALAARPGEVHWRAVGVTCLLMEQMQQKEILHVDSGILFSGQAI